MVCFLSFLAAFSALLAVFSTAPLFVPASATEDEMEMLRQQFEDELNHITKKADELCGLDEITIGNDEKKRRINK